MDKKHQCPECCGAGEFDCQHCGQLMECDECDGTGLDSSKIDLVKYGKAHCEIVRRVGTCALIEDGIEVGRRGLDDANEVLRFDDFLYDIDAVPVRIK